MFPISLTLLFVTPIACHRLIVSPQEYDSVIVSSDPIKITQGKRDNPSEKDPDYAIRLTKNKIGDLSDNRASRNCKYNDISCLYGTEAPKVEADHSDNQEIIDRFLEQYSSITNAKFGADINRTGVEEKSYWNSEKPAQPFEDKKNWVTLDTVPWSTSMVSKWHPNVQPTHPSPSSFEPPSETHHPSEDRPWNYGAMSTQTWTTTRPAPVTTNYGSYTPVASHSPSSKPSYQWGIGNNDIITDNRPTNFPAVNGGYNSVHPPMQNHFSQEYHHTAVTEQVPQPTRYPQINRHPPTYPETGNGEWVLLSTTKGYSLPNGYRGPGKTMNEKPEISRYHEEDIEYVPSSNRRYLDLESENEEKLNVNGLRVLHSENGSIIYAKDTGRRGRSSWNMEETPLQILFSSTKDKEPAITLKRAVRLQVLPHISNTTTFAHDGLLEVDPTFHSVEDEHKTLEEEKIKELSKIAKVRRSNFTLYRVVPATRIGTAAGKSMTDKSTAVLAAVGAGMIPATMAVLVPMALGRKKRSILHESSYNGKRD